MKNDMGFLKQQFIEGNLSKEQYIEQMHTFHDVLFQYSKMLGGCDIQSITITEQHVIMETRKYKIKMYCDPYDLRIVPLEIINFGSYEGLELEFIKTFIQKDSVILDVGANIGYYSMVLSGWASEGKVFAFEPMPKNYKYLIDNLENNNISNVFPQQIAASDENGVSDFYYYKEGLGNSSMKLLSDQFHMEHIECRTQTLDSFCIDNHITVDFIKCDVEGNERFVLLGTQHIIERDKPTIYIELLRKWCAEFGYHPNDVVEYLRNKGYTGYILTVLDGKTVLCDLFDMDNTSVTNFIFIHDSKVHLYKEVIDSKL